MSIDQTYLSPNGKVSDRASKAAKERIRRELFGDGLERPICAQPSAREAYLRQASELRGLAERGMRPRANSKAADELERKANGL